MSAAKKSELEEQKSFRVGRSNSNLTPMIPASEAAGLLGSQLCVQRATTRLFAHFQRKQGAYAHMLIYPRGRQINILDVGLMKCRDVRDGYHPGGSYPKIRGYAYPKYRAKGFYIGHGVAVAVALSSLR